MAESIEREKLVRITVLRHRTTDLLMAVSFDMPGLMVPGRSEDELMAKLPAAIKELEEAATNMPVNVELLERAWDIPQDFVPPPHIADAVIRQVQ